MYQAPQGYLSCSDVVMITKLFAARFLRWQPHPKTQYSVPVITYLNITRSEDDYRAVFTHL